MKKFQSKELESNRSLRELYSNISSFQELGLLMPDQIINWQTTEDECSFTIKNMADISLKYQQRIPDRYVVIESVEAPFRIELSIRIESKEHLGTSCKTTLQADLNPMLAMLASRPLQHLVDTINQKLVR